MKYKISVLCRVTARAEVIVEADGHDELIRKAREVFDGAADLDYEPEWGSADDYQLGFVHTEDMQANVLNDDQLNEIDHWDD
ncbi:MAG TPA: hypothetical protein VFE62_18155 [Gemmataceae bacterium]|nr:hypothetical protein [Gemmataceae bacterium]